jgi:putative membrane protein
MEVEKHRRIARWTWPLWLYVTATGVIVYFMISPYYPA